ncbi:hypothetical protein [Clostridium gasigenes]|uniref:Restriction endonuclease type II-like domain-containing protein n=1 Tax=Clostridium gasigenes TaxID=94869 RepID=A0A1H0NEW1_9CLOT|nr:hypothetical protein [Clostridium gasigenes]SDO91076.1 hypothetical protein SAMN04488529_101803 [Clostridium gasigenes]
MKCLDVKEENLFLISQLDYIQEIAVILANKDNSLIIDGPPSSGKEETIINIISNSLYQGKRVLLISKNLNILNSIYGRLNYINNQISLLVDSDIDLDCFYKNISRSINQLSKNTGSTTLSKIKVLSRDIDKKIEILNSINELFYTVRPCGLNLLDMYKTTEKINNTHILYKYYKIYRIKNPFVNYKYDEINSSVNKLLNEDIIDRYVKYKRFKKNKLFSKLINNISENSLSVAISKISSLLNNPLAFELPLYNSEYKNDFISAFSINNTLKVDSIKALAQLINSKHNSSMLNKDTIINKWSPIYWIRHRSIIKIQQDKEVIFNNLEKKIYLEFLENLENINFYIKAFDFMKDIINKDEYNNFIKTLLKNEDIIDYLTNLKNILNIYQSFKKSTEEINHFDNIENEILTYCYNNTEKKEDIKILLRCIPSLYVNYNIEKIETTETDILYYYKNFEIILKEIQLSINTKISFIPLGIKYIWDNKVSELLRIKDITNPNIADYLNNPEPKLEIYDFLTLFKFIIFDIYPCVILNFNNVHNVLPNIKGLFDVVIFYDGSNIYEDDIEDDIYKENTHIITGESVENPKKCLLNTTSSKYTTTKLKSKCSNLDELFEDDFKFKSYLQKELYDTFIGLGYKIRINVNISGYNLNLVFYNNNYKIPILILECDDIIYNSNYNAREVDIYRRNYLESIGCNIVRVWSRDWWLNKKNEIRRIKEIAEEFLLEFKI